MRISDWSSDVCSSDLIYVANWYYLAFILVVALLHIVNNLAVPASFAGTKSYSLFSGVQDAMTQWWYGHNAVAFFLTAGFLGMLYYYLPKRAGRPIYSRSEEHTSELQSLMRTSIAV